jgi:hypothetical protein
MILIIAFGVLIGCTGLQIKTTADVTSDAAFYLVLKNNPDYKAPVIAGLQRVKTFLAGDVTYDALIIEVSKAFGGRYAYIGILLQMEFDTEKPIFETYATLFEAYKIILTKKIDRLILLAEMP